MSSQVIGFLGFALPWEIAITSFLKACALKNSD